MNIDTQVGIRHENFPADRTNDDDLCVEGQKGCELITSFVVKNPCPISVQLIQQTNINISPTLPTLMCQLKQPK